MKDNTYIIKHDQSGFSIRFSWELSESIYWVNFKAVESFFDDKEFMSYNDSLNLPGTEDFDKAYEENKFFDGFIKWDGCMEIHGLNYHFCGYGDILQRAVKLIYHTAAEIMQDNFDQSLANWSPKNK